MKVILVVDDEFDILTTWQMVLQLEGFTVLTAPNGKIGLEIARSTPPDLIITDWMMPVMDGLELCRMLAKDPALAVIPLILASAAWHEPSVPHPNAVFLRKPVSMDALVDIVRRLIAARGES
ncbi:Two component AraC family transcriptional regulator [Pararobbsia alpina]|uniref:response regulator n=1 Tax=Pararobbsia alpina TaxID=621374 RepID=UPI0039A663D0